VTLWFQTFALKTETGRELLALQGINHGKKHNEKFSEALMSDLAGNACLARHSYTTIYTAMGHEYI